jgi:hypothetical protein
MWRSHRSCIRSWSVLITFKSSELSKEVHSGSIEAFAKHLLVAITNVECCALSFLVLLPIAISSLNRWTSSALVSRPYDVVTPPCHIFRNLTHDAEISWADHCRVPCCLHQIPGWLKDRCSSAVVIKGNPLPRTASARHHHRSCPPSG